MIQRKQTKRASFVETVLNTALGYVIAVSAQLIVFPWFGIDIALSSSLLIGCIFTMVSIARGFVLRRLFETLKVRGILP